MLGLTACTTPSSVAPIAEDSTGSVGTLFGQDARGYPSLASLMRRVTPSVVNISVESRIRDEDHPFLQDPEFRRFLDRIGVEAPEIDPSERRRSMGSGVIVDAKNGYVMTNNHLLKDATKIIVTLKDRRTFRARRIGADPATDVAILKIPPVKVRPLRLGDSDRLEVGDFVIAIGNPFGLGQTVTMGIVSAVGRSGVAGNHLGKLIQTDASINPGNSGGPLINLAGEVIGINTALIGPTGGNVGIGFAMPSNRARAALRKVTGTR
ncbi:trypsin-like peptidase domain-containing protein [Thiorhodococcus minor]|uniref:Trypsin-like serine protease n=1 Tax=Thiorhodococcus minor TaxID=57489 RepID=A0A6M0JW91_9GAMM|nr:trypsin-like peptidase domain-containing protein [Thiorhodococcus minor]NEV60873.1 trypsin-like serine protease [Thiorhodococcus minor]